MDMVSHFKLSGNPVIFSMLSGSSAHEQGDELIITLPPATAPLARMLSSADNMPKLNKVLQKAMGKPLRVRVQTAMRAPSHMPAQNAAPAVEPAPYKAEAPAVEPTPYKAEAPAVEPSKSNLGELARALQETFNIETRIHP
jgi:hypothetical protein